MFAYRATIALCVFFLALSYNPDMATVGAFWAVVPAGLLLVLILDFTELGNAMNR